MAQNQRSVSAGGRAVPKNVILEPKSCFEDWWNDTEAGRGYRADCLRERIKILEDMGVPESGLLGEVRAELLAILLAK